MDQAVPSWTQRESSSAYFPQCETNLSESGAEHEPLLYVIMKYTCTCHDSDVCMALCLIHVCDDSSFECFITTWQITELFTGFSSFLQSLTCVRLEHLKARGKKYLLSNHIITSVPAQGSRTKLRSPVSPQSLSWANIADAVFDSQLDLKSLMSHTNLHYCNFLQC